MVLHEIFVDSAENGLKQGSGPVYKILVKPVYCGFLPNFYKNTNMLRTL